MTAPTDAAKAPRCRARDLDDPESYRCDLPAGHDGPHYSPWSGFESPDEPWERCACGTTRSACPKHADAPGGAP